MAPTLRRIRASMIVVIVMGATSCASNPLPAPGNDYEIVPLKTTAGTPLYGLRCKNGTTDCNYVWADLCPTEKRIQNADPFGGTYPEPAFSRDGQKRPIRLFVCS